MIVVVVVGSALAAGAMDPTSARAVARRNEALLEQAERALAAGDAPTALDRALAVAKDDRRLDRRRLLSLRGRARAAVGFVDDAVSDLRAARAGLAAGDPAHAELTRTLGALERARSHFDECASEMSMLGVAANDDDAVLHATCLRGTARAALAHDVLGARTSPAVRELRARVRLEHGLFRLARQDVSALVDVLDAPALLAFAAAFRAGGDDAYADALVDVALARFPDDEGVTSEAARSPGRSARAALVVGGLAARLREDGRAADAWRATLTLPGAERLRQRLALLVDTGAWDRVWSLAPRLRAAGLIHDDGAYALGFAAFQSGRLEEATRIFDGIGGVAAFARATTLRAAIDAAARRRPATHRRTRMRDACMDEPRVAPGARRPRRRRRAGDRDRVRRPGRTLAVDVVLGERALRTPASVAVPPGTWPFVVVLDGVAVSLSPVSVRAGEQVDVVVDVGQAARARIVTDVDDRPSLSAPVAAPRGRAVVHLSARSVVDDAVLVGARVVLRGVGEVGVVGQDGAVEIDVPAGDVALSVVQPGFMPRIVELTMAAGERRDVVVASLPLVDELDEVTVQAPHIEGGVAGAVAERRA